jgi:hypothetical protein
MDSNVCKLIKCDAHLSLLMCVVDVGTLPIF